MLLIVFTLLGFIFPPFWIVAIALTAHDLARVLKPKVAKPVPDYRPCPRCANTNVTMYSTGYFTCGWCPARGQYPFRAQQDINTRLSDLMVSH